MKDFLKTGHVKKLSGFIGLLAFILSTTQLFGHCQMPCGIYHDEMVFDQIDQYVETMYKADVELNKIAFKTPKEKNTFVRWVLEKEKESDKLAELITTYFLQQKIKPGEEDTTKKLISAHKLLFLLVAIKQGVDAKEVESFAKEWHTFKNMFHVEGYECKVEMMKIKERQEELKKEREKHEAEHTHEHAH